MRKAFLTSVLKLYKKEWARLLLLIGVNLVGVGVMSGLGPAGDVLQNSYSGKMRDANTPDIIALNSGSSALDEELIEEIENLDGVTACETYFTMPYQDGAGDYYQYYIYDYANMEIGKPDLLEGAYPTGEYEIAVETPGNVLDAYEIGDVIHIDFETSFVYTVDLMGYSIDLTLAISHEGDYTVTGILSNAMYGDYNNYPSLLDSETNMKGIFYFSDSLRDVSISLRLADSLPVLGNLDIPLDGVIEYDLPDNALAIRTGDFDSYSIYSDDYAAKIDGVVTDLETLLGSDFTFLTYEENAACVSIEAYADKVSSLSYILSVFFIAVVALVIASTLMRLVEEERGIIACYRSLGVGTGSIGAKYASFALVSIVAGALLGYFMVGEAVLAVIYSAFTTSYAMPTMTSVRSPLFGIVATIVTCAVALISTVLVLYKSLKETPATLLLPKAPKAGRTILLERIKPIWKRLSFKMKSMFRNLFRHPLRSALTLIVVAGSTVLFFAGFGVLNASLFGDTPNAGIISYVAVVIIAVAALLSVLVLTTVTNISVSEKNREIATLMVLGYRDDEVSLYVYREIDFLAIVGIVVGMPLGVLFIMFVFDFVDFGKLADIQWWAYIVVPVLEFIMMIVSNLVMLPKIRNTDMNGSLKAVE